MNVKVSYYALLKPGEYSLFLELTDSHPIPRIGEEIDFVFPEPLGMLEMEVNCVHHSPTKDDLDIFVFCIMKLEPDTLLNTDEPIEIEVENVR